MERSDKLSLNDLKKYLPVVNQVIVISSPRYEKRTEQSKCIHGAEGIENLVTGRKQDELFNYLNSLEFDTLRIVASIMFVGRNSAYAYNDNCWNFFIVVYENARLNFTEKGHLVEHVYKIVQLPKYLKDGCKKIGLVF